MQRSAPFARAIQLMALVHACYQAHPIPGIAQQQALAALPAYESRGKGGRKSRGAAAPHGAGMAAKRAALKARNVRRHRAAVRG
jgi:hypothetical protein